MKHRFAEVVARQALRGRRPGAVLAVMAVSLVALVSVIALAIDIGMLYSGRTEAQRVADAAALAGASAFIDVDPVIHPSEATSLANERALDYATRGELLNNPVVATEVETQIVLDSQRVRVYITRPAVQLIFARVFGVQTSGIAAMATAEAVNAGASSACVKPFAIPDMWGAPGPGDDIYNRPGDPPIWDFDAHLRPNESVIGSGLCKRQGQDWDCPLEAWSVEAASYTGDSGWGSSARNNVPDFEGKTYENDEGRRLPLKLGNESNSQSVPSWWYHWRLPGNAGTNDLGAAIRGCLENVNVGAEGVRTETGMTSNPIWKAFTDFIDQGDGVRTPDPGAYWDEQQGKVVNSIYGDNIKASPRVITIAIVDPTTVRSGMNNMKFVDFATLFLEDPRREYPGISPNFKAPITGRLIKYGSGNTGPEEGSLIKRLRLVQ